MARTPTLQELLLRSDFGRANPQRVRELLDAAIVARTGGVIVEDTPRVRSAEQPREAA